MELIKVIVTVLAALTTTSFVARYWAVRWEDTPTGRSLMGASVSTAMLAWCGVAQRWDELHADVSWRAELGPLITIAWATVCIIFAWRIRELRRSRKDGDDDQG